MMRKKILALGLALVITALFMGCSSADNKIDTSTQTTEEKSPTEVTSEKDSYTYFPSDSLVDSFFQKYNQLTDRPIQKDEIKEGNISTKALVYYDSYSMEVINSRNGFLSVSIGADPDEEYKGFKKMFINCIKALREDLTSDEIEDAWDGMHESGHLTEDYDLNDLDISYMPYQELSQGHSDLRIDIMSPISE